MIDHLNISDWVNQGRDHFEDDSDICPFCQQRTITADFKKELESYFDEEYIANMDLIKKCTDDYFHGTNTLNEAILAIIDSESKNANTKLRIVEFTPLTIALSKAFETNISIIQSKQKESSRSFELTYTDSLIENIIAKISEANAEIDKHNKLVDDYKEEKDRLINDVWRYVSNNTSVEQHIKNIDNIDKAISGISNKIEMLRERYKTLEREIKTKNKNVTSVQPAVDAINDILAHYGFENFRIDPLNMATDIFKRKYGGDDMPTDMKEMLNEVIEEVQR